MTEQARELVSPSQSLEFFTTHYYSVLGEELGKIFLELRRLQDVEKRFEYLRKLNVIDFQTLYVRCLKENLRFDDFVLNLANGEVEL